MKSIARFTVAAMLSLTFFSSLSFAHASAKTYTVQAGDSIWKIANKYGVSVLEIKRMNNKINDLIFPNEKLTIPDSISDKEKDLLARLVSAEAKGEPFAGKVAVATVVLNRVEHKDFPNTITDVIYEKTPGGSYAFTPVANGTIHQPADDESIKAVNEALAFEGQGNGSLYFYNPKTATSNWIFTREKVTQIGNHVFAK